MVQKSKTKEEKVEYVICKDTDKCGNDKCSHKNKHVRDYRMLCEWRTCSDIGSITWCIMYKDYRNNLWLPVIKNNRR